MQLYKQTTKYTCAASSLAMIINHFRPDFLLNIDNEFDIWHKTAALPTRGSSIYALAIYAHQKGVPLKVVVGEHEYKFPGYKFKAYKKKEIEIANFSSQLFYRHAKDRGIVIEENEFTLEDVKSALKDGNVVLLRLIAGIVRDTKENKRNSHYLPVYGYRQGVFSIMDPKKGQLAVSEAVVHEAFEKVSEVKRDHRMIVFG
ncbi:peptidase C39 family protein [Candidatus Woesearchaeota archaeon]|nr:peptidase C39 family protein [Candidatus Woesearchaeota archaeon]